MSGRDTDVSMEGVVQGHAYSILQVREVDSHRLLCMRNPWGKTEWKGPWSDGAPEWTPRYKNLLNQHDDNDGTFWIAFADFCRVFRIVYACKLFIDWHMAECTGAWTTNTAGGCLNYRNSFPKNPQVTIGFTAH